MGYVVRDLAGYQAADLAPVVAEAFADYVIPLRPDAASLDALLTCRGWEPAWSFGLFRARQLAGVWLTGRDDGRGEAYCVMTGIVPAARGHGAVEALFAPVLAAAGGRPHRLEVIRGNERAARAYRRLGFRATRELNYYHLPGAGAVLGEPGWAAVAEPWTHAALPPESWLAYPAAWQNRREAQRLAPRPPAWLLVREGGLLRGSAVRHASPGRLALSTVDARDHVLCSWLARCGAELRLSQDEMVHDLGPDHD